MHADVEHWTAERDQIRDAVLTRGWSEARQAYAQSFDSDELDAAQLLMPILGFLPATDERMRSTIDAIADELTEDGLVLRYRNEEGLNADGLTGEEGTFVICSFWLVSALAKAGEVERAEQLFDQLAGYANDLGLLAEEIDTATGELLGQLPPGVQPHRPDHRRVGDRQGAGAGVMTRRPPSASAHTPGFDDVVGDAPRLSRSTEVDAHEGPVYFADEDALYFTTLPRPGRRPVAARFRSSASPLDEPERCLGAGGGGERRQRHGARPRRQPARVRAGKPLASPPGSAASTARTGEREPVVEDWRGLAASTRRTTSSSQATARSGSPTRPTATSRASARADRRRLRVSPRSGRRRDARSSPTASTSPTASRSRRTSASCTSPTAAPTRSRAATTSTRPHHIKAFDVIDGRRLAGERLFAVVTPGFPDGLKVDRDGRVYASSFSGVQVFDPDGRCSGEIRVPGAVNFCFGGRRARPAADHHRLGGLGRRTRRERSLTMTT